MLKACKTLIFLSLWSGIYCGLSFAPTAHATPSSASALAATFIRGDVNLDEQVQINDPILLLSWLFTPGASAIGCLDSADANDDGSANIADAILLLNYLFVGGVGALPAPFPNCDIDPTPDSLNCGESPCFDDVPVISLNIILDASSEVGGLDNQALASESSVLDFQSSGPQASLNGIDLLSNISSVDFGSVFGRQNLVGGGERLVMLDSEQNILTSLQGYEGQTLALSTSDNLGGVYALTVLTAPDRTRITHYEVSIATWTPQIIWEIPGQMMVAGLATHWDESQFIAGTDVLGNHGLFQLSNGSLAWLFALTETPSQMILTSDIILMATGTSSGDAQMFEFSTTGVFLHSVNLTGTSGKTISGIGSDFEFRLFAVQEDAELRGYWIDTTDLVSLLNAPVLSNPVAMATARFLAVP